MSTLVESLKRLFFNEKISEERLTTMIGKSITQEEFVYITTQDNN